MANIRWSPTYVSRALNLYLLSLKEGQQDGDRYVIAEGVNGIMPRFVEQQFRAVRRKWQKDGLVMRKWKRTGTDTLQGEFVQAYHGIISFGQDELDPNDPEAWETALRIARATVREVFPTRQAMVVLQNDGAGGCLHVHVSVNSVDEKTGRSIDSSVTTHTYRERQADGSYELAGMALRFNEILEREGFQQRADLVEMMAEAQQRVRQGGSAKLRAKDRREASEQRQAEKHEDWLIRREESEVQGIAFSEPEPFSVAVLKQRVKQAMRDPRSTGFDAFVEVAKEHRVDVELRPGTRGLAYVMLDEAGEPVAEGTRARRRASTLGSGFMLDTVEAQCAENDALEAIREANAITDETARMADALDEQRAERARQEQEAKQSAEREEAERKAQRIADAAAEAKALRLESVRGAVRAALEPEEVRNWEEFEERLERFGYMVLEDEETGSLTYAPTRFGDRSRWTEAELGEAEFGADALRELFTERFDAWLAVDRAEQERIAEERLRIHREQSDRIAARGAAAARTADEGRSTPSAAATGTEEAAAAAPAASAEQSARSRLRDAVSKSEQRQAVITAFAAFEERAAEALRAGRRIDDSEVPKGVGEGFLKAFGEQMFPTVLAQMELREAKKALRKAAFDEGAAAKRELDEGLAAAEKRVDLYWKYGSEAKQLEERNRESHERVERLEREMRAGVYEVAPEAEPGVVSHDEDLISRDAQQRREQQLE